VPTCAATRAAENDHNIPSLALGPVDERDYDEPLIPVELEHPDRDETDVHTGVRRRPVIWSRAALLRY
jgi:hypothetical protein